ncbi:MAG: DUF5671 domain-containing protein [Patescibacteria group bacterium]|nr:DUF5671 domain-containing protein [Patescibacteria group bacterium]
MTEDLKSFIKDALVAKLPRPQIQSALEAAGWPKEEIVNALALFAESDFPLPVPRPKPYMSAREAFIYLLMFLCLYLSAWSFGAIIFSLVNQWLPDLATGYQQPIGEAVRMPIAMLVVSFPVYFTLTWRTVQAVKRDTEKRASKIRKWLTYLTLFVAAGTIIGDLIALLYNLLGGELTLRFGLKVLTVLFIAGMIFGYYLWDLRNEEKKA